MKFKIKNEAPEEIEEPVVLYLEKQPNGVVRICAETKDVGRFILAYLQIDGTLTLCGGISKIFGFQLDNNGRIKIT